MAHVIHPPSSHRIQSPQQFRRRLHPGTIIVFCKRISPKANRLRCIFKVVSCAQCSQAIHALCSPQECVLKFYMFLIQDPNNSDRECPDLGTRMFHRLGILVEESLGVGKSQKCPVLSLMSSRRLVPRGGDHQAATGRPQLHQLRPSLWQARAVGWCDRNA